jgi:hypothetical protein
VLGWLTPSVCGAADQFLSSVGLGAGGSDDDGHDDGGGGGTAEAAAAGAEQAEQRRRGRGRRSVLAGVGGLSGPYSVERLHTEAGLLVRAWMRATRTTVWRQGRRRPEGGAAGNGGGNGGGADLSMAPPLREREVWALADPATHLRAAAAASADHPGARKQQQQQQAQEQEQDLRPATVRVAHDAATSPARPKFVLMVGEAELTSAGWLAGLASVGLGEQMRALATVLRECGHEVLTHVVPNKNHATMVSQLGHPTNEDTVSPLLMEAFGLVESAP